MWGKEGAEKIQDWANCDKCDKCLVEIWDDEEIQQQ